ncbi:MAG: outer membrane lipoprotein-sorting protein [Flammeovirgaceae bacterium]|nr:outer membrane lipoprotein-sorting protein [Flammeovirgaceae bacterium]|tara:strand:- start:14480 stop:15223 length:744 start_codon:yes stop_codon:yes gene_type:complete
MRKLLIVFLFFLSYLTFSQDANNILKQSEEKIRGVKSSYTEMIITVVRPKWKKEMTMKGWSVGEDYFTSVVLSPAKEKGTVFLKRENEVWNYVPSIERTIKLPPSMMMQNWMGTDFTNDDLVQRSSITDDYTNTIIGEETIDDLDCWIIQLIPKEDAPVVWGKLIMWIDKKDYMQLKTQFFDEYDDMVNVMNSKIIKNFGGKKLPSVIEFVPLEKEGNKTIVERLIWKFDIDINERFFMPNYMKNLR